MIITRHTEPLHANEVRPNRQMKEMHDNMRSACLPAQSISKMRRATTPLTTEYSMSEQTALTALRIESFGFAKVVGETWYTRDFKYLLNQKTIGIRSGDYEGHSFNNLDSLGL